MVRLTLVRHGRSTVDPAVPPHHWLLAAEAAAGMAMLRASGLLLRDALTERPPDLAAWERMAMPDLATLDVPADEGGPATLLREWA